MARVRSRMLDTAAERAARLASLATVVLALSLVPVPAVAVAVRLGIASAASTDLAMLLKALLAATPLFAVPPFVLGGGLGSFFHLVVTAPERFAAIEAGQSATVDARAMAASALVVGSVLAASGLVLAETALRF